MLKIAAVFMASFFLMVANASASGTSYSSSSSDGTKVDRAYEYGKSLYKGRIASVGKVKFCIASGDNVVKVKRDTLKAYAGSSFSGLGYRLVNCEQPAQRIVDKLGEKNTGFVLHYLDKRYKLKLRRS